MYRRSIEKVSGISGMRKALARQHVSPDGLLTRLENLPFDPKPDLTLNNYWEEPNSVPSRYFLDISHSSIKERKTGT